MIVILEYGIGNLSSVRNMLKKAGIKAVISGNPDDVRQAEKIILPGVGHFDHCMSELRKAHFFDALCRRVLEEKTPLLGVCVGHQMLFEASEEGQEKGLGWIPGKVVKFKPQQMPGRFKIPHMDWTDVEPVAGSVLFAGISEPRFYFVHSYYAECAAGYVQATAEYGYRFTASVCCGNIFGVQFHPEKSHRFGMQVYKNFAEYAQG